MFREMIRINQKMSHEAKDFKPQRFEPRGRRGYPRSPMSYATR